MIARQTHMKVRIATENGREFKTKQLHKTGSTTSSAIENINYHIIKINTFFKKNLIFIHSARGKENRTIESRAELQAFSRFFLFLFFKKLGPKAIVRPTT